MSMISETSAGKVNHAMRDLREYLSHFRNLMFALPAFHPLAPESPLLPKLLNSQPERCEATRKRLS